MLEMNDAEDGFDRILNFSIPQRSVRGRVVRLGPLADAILRTHAYPPAIQHLLAEGLVVISLLGGLLKDDGSQLTMQVQTQDGPVRLMVCDYKSGEIRGYIQFDADQVTALGPNVPLEALVGKGALAITYDLAATGQRYQGIVSLEGLSLGAVCENYFAQSEQIPTLIRTAVHTGNGSCQAGGLLIQHLAEGEVGRERLHVRLDHPDWEAMAVLGGSIRYEELLDSDLTAEDLVWRLFHEEAEVRVNAGAALSRGCRCSLNHFESTLQQFSDSALDEMRQDDGRIEVDCAFCSKLFHIEI